MSRHDATTGIVQGNDEYDHISRDASYRQHIATMAKDKLLSLAEAVGAIPPENPEQGAFGEAFDLDADWLVDEISRRFEMSIAPPAIDGGLLKIRTKAGLFGERDLNAIYTAHLLVDQMPTGRTSDVCEIGGGSGRVAYWSYRLGLRSYTLIDLPHVNVVQGYYLLRSLPEVDITLHGEPQNDQARIRILPNDALPSNWRVDLVVNQDSFPEIHRQTVIEYLLWIRSVSRYFLSINHESRPPYSGAERQLNVPELVAEVSEFDLRSRNLYWLRKGYVVSLYEVRSNRDSRPRPFLE